MLLVLQQTYYQDLRHKIIVILGGVNLAEALVSKGLATVVRYAADNDQRSSR